MLNIALIGYGKMGKTIEKIALDKGHQVSIIIDLQTAHSLSDLHPGLDVAIEFSRPDAAQENLSACMRAGVPVVSGTTGWLEAWEDIVKICEEENCAFFYASNYSIGVNIFFELNKWLAKKMSGFEQYQIDIKEIHHTEKLDAPSGTAITLAEGIVEQQDRMQRWCKGAAEQIDEIPIFSERESDVPGTHVINYRSEIDTISISHTAHSRLGFAHGALRAAEWLVGKKGVFSMSDLLEF